MRIPVSHSQTRKRPSVVLVQIEECEIHSEFNSFANELTPKL